MFCSFGPAKILQSDNGKEFVAKVVTEIGNLWSELVIIHGRPRHPQNLENPDRGNGDLQLKLGKWIDDHDDQGWSRGLKFGTHVINTSTAATHEKTPYELVFGQQPRQDYYELEILAEQGVLDEANIQLVEHSEEDLQDTDEEDNAAVRGSSIIRDWTNFRHWMRWSIRNTTSTK